MIFTYGDLPVPWTVMWSKEDKYFIADCVECKLPAICQNSAQGEGVPKFGTPHTLRQRKVMFRGLCDICAKPLKNSTKISLSNLNGNIQIEPLLHRDCAIQSIKYCPSLKRQLEAGRLTIKQVFDYSPKAIIASREDMEKYVPEYDLEKVVGLAAIEIKYREQNLTWLNY